MGIQGLVVANVIMSVLVFSAAEALAADPKLVCQAYPAEQDCLKVEGNWPASKQLSFVASCVECEGGGGWDFCQDGGEETISPEVLSVRDATDNKPIAGTFTKLTECIGSALYLFDGKLGGGTYWVVASLADPHGETLLFELKIAGGPAPTNDGGTTAPGDGGTTTPTGDGPTTTPASDGAGSSDGDGGAHDPEASDGGCDCGISGGNPTYLLPFLPLLLVRRRLRN